MLPILPLQGLEIGNQILHAGCCTSLYTFIPLSMQFLVILALAIALVAVLFAIQNPGVVAVNFFVWAIQERLALILLLTLAAGVLVGVLVSIPAILKRSMRISRHRRQLEELKWQTQQKEEQLSVHHQEKAIIFQQQRELLTALNTVEPNTGLLRGEFVPPTLAYLLHRMASNASNPRYSSIAVFRLEASPAGGTPDPGKGFDLATEARSLQAIAHRLEQTVPAESWLYYEETAHPDPIVDEQGSAQGRFTCIVSGLSTKAASDYGEMLRSVLADQVLELDNGTKLPVSVSVGGAITSPANQLNSRALLQEADAALEHAKRRGRNRFRLVEAKA